MSHTGTSRIRTTSSVFPIQLSSLLQIRVNNLDRSTTSSHYTVLKGTSGELLGRTNITVTIDTGSNRFQPDLLSLNWVKAELSGYFLVNGTTRFRAGKIKALLEQSVSS